MPLVEPSEDALRLLWHAPVGPVTAPLVPVFMGQTDIPVEYGLHRYLTTGESSRFLYHRHDDDEPGRISTVPQNREVTRSAFQVQKRLMHLAFRLGPDALRDIRAHWRAMEARLAEELPDIVASGEILMATGRADLAALALTRFSAQALSLALQDAEALSAAYEVLLRNAGGLKDGGAAMVPEQIW